jgi:hypothetical protein
MQRIRHGIAAMAAAVIGLGILASAQAPASVSARHVRAAPLQVGRLVSAPVKDAIGSFSPLPHIVRGVSVQGVVQNQLGAPVPNAGTVLVRDLLSNTIAASGPVDEFAQFNMRAVPPGLYTAELVARSGAVIASSPAFSARAGEVIRISQTINSAPLQGLSRAAARATAAALSSAASSGVMAIAPGASVTPGR